MGLTSPSSLSAASRTCGHLPVRLLPARRLCGSVYPSARLAGAPNAANYVTRDQAERVAQAIGARAYKECSALKIEGVDDVFEAATRASMLMREGVPAHASGHQHGRHGGSLGARRASTGDGWEEKGRCCVIC